MCHAYRKEGGRLDPFGIAYKALGDLAPISFSHRYAREPLPLLFSFTLAFLPWIFFLTSLPSLNTQGEATLETSFTSQGHASGCQPLYTLPRPEIGCIIGTPTVPVLGRLVLEKQLHFLGLCQAFFSS